MFVIISDPHIKVAGKRDAVLLAKDRILTILDTKVNNRDVRGGYGDRILTILDTKVNNGDVEEGGGGML